ncbi:MAG: nucleoside phosphorylase [Bacteroidetes bacterium]|nr:nucleoside phosphorylase [Bacteroidota bacterium]
MQFPDSELIINLNGSIYHLNLLPEQIANTIFLVGDPDRVPKVSKHFDHIEHKVQKREFVTHTGTLDGKRLTVISTGISTDNIDIVMNELDALANIDLKTREEKIKKTSLDIIRIGTSGSLQKEVPVDSFLASSFGLGLDNLLHFYAYEKSQREVEIEQQFIDLAKEETSMMIAPYACQGDMELIKKIGANMHQGITLTAAGFYAPQGRQLRPKAVLAVDFFRKASHWNFGDLKLTNLEMETAAIYGLANILGHRALSCNAILANRATNEFSKNPKKTVEILIEKVLEKTIYS